MFLTTFAMNPVRRGAQKLLMSPHAIHAAVLAGFPDPSPTDTGRVLWRLDRTEHRTNILIASPRRPDLTHLAEQAGWPALEDSWQTRPYDGLLAQLETGHRYRFRLTANPTRSERNVPGGRGKTYGHITVAQQEQWLLQRAEASGFAVEPVDDDPEHGRNLVVKDRKTITFRRRETAVTLRVATFEGVLRVTDPDLLRHTLTFGLGRAKGYGCGLLTLAPTG